MCTITVSRQLGSGGSEIAARVASIRGLRFVDREIIHRAAQEAGVPDIALEEMEYEGHRSFIERIMEALHMMPAIPSVPEASLREAQAYYPMPFGGILGPIMLSPLMTMEDYVSIVNEVIRDCATGGNVVIVGRAGQIILRDMPHTFHVQIIAPLELRIETIMARQGLSHQAAAEYIAASDQARIDYLRRYHRADWLDPHLYDLVINRQKISVAEAAHLIVTGCQALEKEDK
ncbi:MAG: AAA family ATPase [Anaerolineae bacterium]